MNEFISQPMSFWVVCTFVALFLISGVFLLAFAQFTMRRIEKQIYRDMVSNHKTLDFGGTRIVTFAYAIVFSERVALRMDRLIDVNVIRKYATKTDWWLGLFFILTTHVWIVFILASSLLEIF